MGFFAGTAVAKRWLLTSGLSFVSMWTLQARAIDFKVEFPPQEGVLSPEDSMFFDDALAVSEGQADSPYLKDSNQRDNERASTAPSKKSSTVSAAQKEASPQPERAGEPPLLRVVAQPISPVNAVPAVPVRGIFPNLSCLSDNVSFWKRVYAEVDTNEALIHDRDELDKVYATVRLGGSERQRQQSIRMLKEHYQLSLRSLAGKISAPKTWTQT
ncbi:MAG: hypothetical protein RI932_2085, partial [Pseudomonadota bacterium]